jgi:hypothetical protein
VRHYTLSSEDLVLINRRRGDPNRGSSSNRAEIYSKPPQKRPLAVIFRSETAKMGIWPRLLREILARLQGCHVPAHFGDWSPSAIAAPRRKLSFEPTFGQSRPLHRFSVPLLPNP